MPTVDRRHLILVRHAQTTANVEGRWMGRGESALTEQGKRQVAATARRLAAERRRVAAIYTSPLPRARETAAGIGQAVGLDPIPLDDLREIDFGRLDGLTLAEMAAQHPALYARWQDKTDTDFAWPGGERRGDFFRRVAAACDQILARHPQGRIAVVGHGGTIRAALAHLLPEQLAEWWAYALDNCGITELAWENETARMVVLNDTRHLEEKNMPTITVPTYYFEQPGPQNSAQTLDAARRRAEELGLQTVLVASTTGATGAQAVAAFQQQQVVVVTHSTGFEAPNVQELQAEHRAAIEAGGGQILTCQHALGGVNRAVRKKMGTYLTDEIIAYTLRTFGQGVKVCLEIAMMAADAGLVRVGEPCVAVAGTEGGADTAVVLVPANAQSFFDLRVLEILAKPHGR